MKQSLLAFHLLLSTIIFCQDSIVTKSKYEIFSSNTGVMLSTEVFDIGKVNGRVVKVLKTTNMESGRTEKALFIQQRSTIIKENKPGSIIIDWEELSEFVQALRKYKGLLSSKPKNDMLYSYTTVNGVRASCTYIDYGPQNRGWDVELTKYFNTTNIRIPDSDIDIKNRNLDDIIELIDKALSLAI